jgi:hypothetical protein
MNQPVIALHSQFSTSVHLASETLSECDTLIRLPPPANEDQFVIGSNFCAKAVACTRYPPRLKQEVTAP